MGDPMGVGPVNSAVADRVITVVSTPKKWVKKLSVS